MPIRPFRRSDASAARVLLRELGAELTADEFEARIERVLADPGHHVAVAEQADGRVLGLLHVFERPALEKPCEAVVQALVVDADARGGGIGQALMRTAEAWARSRRLGSVALQTRRAQAFYARLGYEVVATSALMRKQLTQREKS
jgi:GNAT superfamily N-acetyltransferase